MLVICLLQRTCKQSPKITHRCRWFGEAAGREVIEFVFRRQHPWSVRRFCLKDKDRMVISPRLFIPRRDMGGASSATREIETSRWPWRLVSGAPSFEAAMHRQNRDLGAGIPAHARASTTCTQNTARLTGASPEETRGA